MASTYHSSDGASYEWFLGRWTQRLASALVAFADLPPAGAILDIGTGTGSLARTLAAGAPRRSVIGIDVSEPYLAFATDNARLPNLSFQKGDAAQLPFPNGHFTAGLSQLVLTFVPDFRAAARELLRVLQPGGIGVAAVWDFRGGLVYQRLFWDTVVAADPGAAVVRDRLFSHPLSAAGGLQGLWEEAGFKAIASDSLTIRMDFADFADYWDPLLGGQGPVGVYVSGLPESRRAEMRTRVRDAYLSGGADGPRSMTATAWAVRGRAP